MASPIPSQIAAKLSGQHFKTFDHFARAFWMAVAEDPVLSSQFVPAQLKGWPLRAPFAETAKGLRSYEICHLIPPALGGEMYDVANLRIMSALHYALSSEVDW